jgi:hypothetical protein
MNIENNIEPETKSTIVPHLAIVLIDSQTGQITDNKPIEIYGERTAEEFEKKAKSTADAYYSLLGLVQFLDSVINDFSFTGDYKQIATNLILAYINNEKKELTKEISREIEKKGRIVVQKGTKIEFWKLDLVKKINESNDLGSAFKMAIKLAISGIWPFKEELFGFFINSLGQSIDSNILDDCVEIYEANKEKYMKILKKSKLDFENMISESAEFNSSLSVEIITKIIEDLKKENNQSENSHALTLNE